MNARSFPLLRLPSCLDFAPLTSSNVSCACLRSLNLAACLVSLFSPPVPYGFFKSANVYVFPSYHRDANEICALPGPIGLPEMSIRHCYSTRNKNHRGAQISAHLFSPVVSFTSKLWREGRHYMPSAHLLCVQWLVMLRCQYWSVTGCRIYHHLERRR